ncbi:MAG TPA: toll/interleukin-1 receptor domain-containing protein [Candidatus Dormibacteraeota bacterium]|nr:toll/interleukin-1 receptor domain-containing protein [Candidatus Dormibacteraeota bacterium]
MPIFISYSHADNTFVDKLALSLVKHDAHVWVDTWELNVGDSILNRVQEAIRDSSALLIVLSKASVASEWCKKELSAGLMRELDEKRVVVLPVLVEDCEIPVFLREKLYADFRKDFKSGLKALLEAVARVTKIDQGRLKSGESQIDWSETWGSIDGAFHIDYTLIESHPDWPFTLLTEISISCDEGATKRYEQYREQNLDWFGRAAITEALCDFATKEKIEMLLTDQHPQLMKVEIRDSGRGMSYRVQIRCRRMGQDNGRDQLVKIANYIEQIRNHIRTTARKPTEEEIERLMSHLSKR